MSARADAQSAIEDIVHRIAERFSPEKIILFGSHARGDAGVDSDIDLLVLFSNVEDAHARAGQIYAALIGCSAIPKDIVVSTTARFERYRNVVNTVYWPAAHEGRILYERTA
jgi:predicted nucleotidyltransferase